MQQPLLLRVLNENGTNDVTVMLSTNEVFWCPMNRDTKSMIVYEKRGFLELLSELKPEGANYYESYPDGYWKTNNTIEDEEFVNEDDFNSDEVVVDETEEAETTFEQVNNVASDDQQKGKWSDDDLKWLKKNYPKHGLSYCAENLNRNRSSVKKKVEALKLRRAR